MKSRYLILICLFSAFLSACVTTPSASYPSSPVRNALIENIIARSMQASRIGTELKENTGSPQSIAKRKTDLARQANRTPRPDAYWRDYQSIEQSYATVLSQTDDLALDAFRKQMQTKLSYATDDQLLEFSNDNRLLDNNTFLYLGRRYDLIRNDYAAFRKIYPVNCLRSYTQAMDDLEKKYPIR